MITESNVSLPQPGTYIGDVTTDRTIILASLQKHSRQSVYAVALLVTIASVVSPDQSNFWLLQTGTSSENGVFSTSLKENSLSGGLSAGVLHRIAYAPPVLLSQGNALILCVVSRGSPAPLNGLSVAVEWGILPSVTSR